MYLGSSATLGGLPGRNVDAESIEEQQIDAESTSWHYRPWHAMAICEGSCYKGCRRAQYQACASICFQHTPVHDAQWPGHPTSAHSAESILANEALHLWMLLHTRRLSHSWGEISLPRPLGVLELLSQEITLK